MNNESFAPDESFFMRIARIMNAAIRTMYFSSCEDRNVFH